MMSRRGFTLVELLVVVGIISVLVGILLPALGRARQQANRVSCLANLHSVGTALTMYVSTYKGTLPEGSSPDGSTTWVSLLLQQMGYGDGTVVSAGTQDTNKARGVFLCKEAARFDPQPRSNYACHPLLMPDMAKTYPATFPEVALQNQQRRPYRLTRLQNTSEIVLVFDTTQGMDDGGAYVTGLNLDGNRISDTTTSTKPGCTYLLLGASAVDQGASIDGGLNVDSPGSPAAPAGDAQHRWANIRWRHAGNTMANFLFADGHADGRRYKSQYQTEVLRKNIDVPQP